MAGPDLTADLLNSISHGVTPATVLQVRKSIYSYEPLTPSDMDLVLDVAQKAGLDPCPEWTGLFCEAMVDYVVRQNEPQDYIPPEKADWLIAQLTAREGIASKSEFAMLVDLMTAALSVPAQLSKFALQELKTAIVSGRREPAGEDHPADTVTQSDVEALRTVLYAATTGTASHVTQEEAESFCSRSHTPPRMGGSIPPSTISSRVRSATT